MSIVRLLLSLEYTFLESGKVYAAVRLPSPFRGGAACFAEAAFRHA